MLGQPLAAELVVDAIISRIMHIVCQRPGTLASVSIPSKCSGPQALWSWTCCGLTYQLSKPCRMKAFPYQQPAAGGCMP